MNYNMLHHISRPRSRIEHTANMFPMETILLWMKLPCVSDFSESAPALPSHSHLADYGVLGHHARAYHGVAYYKKD
eukprot:9480263-Pyramimonas_sp.AAC.1